MLDSDAILAAVQEDDSIGFCRDCGEEQMGVEPDAENLECVCCGLNEVFGAEQLLIMGYAEE